MVVISEVTPTPKEIEEEFKEGKLREIPLDQLSPNPYQARVSIHPESLLELTESIREHGVLEPILVAETEEGFKIIAGERRFRAAKVAGLSTIPALVKKVAEDKMLLLGLIENLQRKDLNVYEKALCFKDLAEKFNLTHEQIGQKLGLSRASVTQALRLLNLPEEVLQGLALEKITEAHGRALLMLKDQPADCLSLYRKILKENLSSTEAVRLARQILGGKRIAKKAPKSKVLRMDAETRGMEVMIRETLGLKDVTLKRSRSGKGSLTIKFASEEELKRIFKKFAG